MSRMVRLPPGPFRYDSGGLWPDTGGDALGAAVTSDGASSATKGTIVELITAAAFTGFSFELIISGYAANATASAMCCDVMVGSAGNEVPLVANVLGGQAGLYTAQERGGKALRFPLTIEKGERISARIAGERLATAARILVRLCDHGGRPPHRPMRLCDTLGIGTVPGGTSTPAGASNAQGSWVQISASLPQNYKACVLSAQVAVATTAMAARMYTHDLGLGGAGSEVKVGDSRIWSADNVETMSGPHFDHGPIIMPFAAGLRASSRMSSSGTANGMGETALHFCR